MPPATASTPPATPKDPLTPEQNLQLIGVTLLTVLLLVGLLLALRIANSARARARFRRAAGKKRRGTPRSAWVESGRRAQLATPGSPDHDTVDLDPDDVDDGLGPLDVDHGEPEEPPPGDGSRT